MKRLIVRALLALLLIALIIAPPGPFPVEDARTVYVGAGAP